VDVVETALHEVVTASSGGHTGSHTARAASLGRHGLYFSEDRNDQKGAMVNDDRDGNGLMAYVFLSKANAWANQS
jgi:hypothetical protein